LYFYISRTGKIHYCFVSFSRQNNDNFVSIYNRIIFCYSCIRLSFSPSRPFRFVAVFPPFFNRNRPFVIPYVLNMSLDLRRFVFGLVTYFKVSTFSTICLMWRFRRNSLVCRFVHTIFLLNVVDFSPSAFSVLLYPFCTTDRLSVFLTVF